MNKQELFLASCFVSCLFGSAGPSPENRDGAAGGHSVGEFAHSCLKATARKLCS